MRFFMISLNCVAHLPEGEWWNNRAWGRNWPRVQHWTAPRSLGPKTRLEQARRTLSGAAVGVFGPGLSFWSLTHALAREDSRQTLPPKPGRDWLNEPINQSGSLAWAGLQRPRQGQSAAASPRPQLNRSLAQRKRSPSLSLDRVRPFRWRELED